MATWRSYHTARKDHYCDDYPRCGRGIKRGERYARWVATPGDELGNDHWWVLKLCVEHMRPESPDGAA